jgi:hypothetical protein
MFRPFQQLIGGIVLPKEGFSPFEHSDARFWTLGLSGKHHLIGLIRIKLENWRHL